MQENGTPSADGKPKATVADLWTFLERHVFNNPSSVAVEGAEISLLWSFQLGDVSTQPISKDMARRSNASIRFIGNTVAGEFLAYLDSNAGEEEFLAFKLTDQNTSISSDVLTKNASSTSSDIACRSSSSSRPTAR